MSDGIRLIFSNVDGFVCFVCFQQHYSAASIVQTNQHSLRLTNKKGQWLYLFNIIIKEKLIVKKQYKQSALYITYYQQRVSKNAVLRQSTEVYLKFIRNLSARPFQSNCFDVLYARSNEQGLLQSALYLTFYQKNFGRNAMFK